MPLPWYKVWQRLHQESPPPSVTLLRQISATDQTRQAFIRRKEPPMWIIVLLVILSSCASGFQPIVRSLHVRKLQRLPFASMTTPPEGSMPDVVCAKGISAEVVETEIQLDSFDSHEPMSLVEMVMSSYLGPRLVLGVTACIYGTNFPLGAIMDEALPASAVTCARMVIASLVLSPFLLQIKPNLAARVILCGCFTSMGYITQSLALVDTSPAKVSFLGAAAVLVCPLLEFVVDRKPIGLRNAPQIWLAAVLCLAGVGILELWDPSGSSINPFAQVGWGDALALLQAVGFGTSIFLSEKMMKGEPSQALPITAGLVGTTAFISMIWCFSDNWMQLPGSEAFMLPNLFFEPSLSQVALALVWTGVVSTSMNFVVEVAALGRVPPAEASVILATEPLWAALFATFAFSESFGANDYVGGALIIAACLANTLQPVDLRRLMGDVGDST